MTFECGFSGITESPSWNINGEDYFVSELPPPHIYNVSLMSLIISPVERRLNNSVYYCFFVTYSPIERKFVRIRSDHAVLIIPAIIHTLIQPDSILPHGVVATQTVCCGKVISPHFTSPVATTTAIQFQFSLSHAKSLKLNATSTLQSYATLCVPSITSNLTTMTETVTTPSPGVMQNLSVQGF